MKFYQGFVFVFKCVDVKSGKSKDGVSYTCDISQNYGSMEKIFTSLYPKFIIDKMDKIMPTSNVKLLQGDER